MERRLSTSTDIRIQKNIQNKRMYQACPASLLDFNEEAEPPKQFDHFLILGHPSESMEKPQPKLLAMFPSRPLIYSSSEIDNIINFCYPQGLMPIQTFSRPNIPLINNKWIITGFVFYLEKLTRVYGIVLHIKIPNESNNFIGSQYNRNYPFCLCLLSRKPFIATHFKFLSEIANGIINNIQLPSKSMPIPENLQNPHGNCHPSLIIHQKCPLIAVAMGIRVPRFLLPELLTYYSSHFQPALKASDYLLYPTLYVLFSCFSPRDIVKIYSALLLELHIVFYSSDINRLSFCIIAATSLVFPLKLEAKVLPIMPSTEYFRPMLDSPFPYVIGFTQRYEKADIFIDLDRGRIIENVPLIHPPRFIELVAKVELLLQNYQVQITVPSKSSLKTLISKQRFDSKYMEFTEGCDQRIFPKCFREFVETKYIFMPSLTKSIIKLFYNHIIPPLTDLIKVCFVTDSTIQSAPVTVFNKDLFLLHVPEETTNFFQSFLSTQAFQQYIDILTDEFQIKRSDSIQFQQSQYQMNFIRIRKRFIIVRCKSLPSIVKPVKTLFI
ncbi:hypothetical protein TRFO_37776 [Tritrichomonas foetus]|uniref:UDENN domain-containing protein n=1 Tax=Tritrichomonas foetus TaxID=1144522 RepID=A0A1J4JCW5_9EUKA|nr:hypothetical protein TRFO_37776 [Tritrichomonas foetus]|eukprot:OHS96103.1 hypothetical protein TRFO_37776 [Tritrichomonas foetus]